METLLKSGEGEHFLAPSRARNEAQMKRNGKSTPTIKTVGKTDRNGNRRFDIVNLFEPDEMYKFMLITPSSSRRQCN